VHAASESCPGSDARHVEIETGHAEMRGEPHRVLTPPAARYTFTLRTGKRQALGAVTPVHSGGQAYRSPSGDFPGVF
jgi:hypothetical protein